MSKSPKIAPTPSWRTLVRRAKNMKLPKAERMQLREQASSLRRAERKAAKKPVSNKRRLEAMREQGFTPANTDAKFFEQPESPLWHVDPGQDTSDELTIGNRGDARMVELQKIAQGLEAELRRHDEIAIAEFIESVALKKAYITPGEPKNFLCIPISQINAILRALQKK